MVAGPPAVEDERHNKRIVALDASLATECNRHAVPYVSVLGQGHEIWRREVSDGDGTHPGADGYEVLATLLRPAWGLARCPADWTVQQLKELAAGGSMTAAAVSLMALRSASSLGQGRRPPLAPWRPPVG